MTPQMLVDAMPDRALGGQHSPKQPAASAEQNGAIGLDDRIGRASRLRLISDWREDVA